MNTAKLLTVVLTGSGAEAPVPNWLVGGIPAANCIAAYEPEGAASLAASYINLANPGVGNAAPGTAPDWDATNGWKFLATSSQYLDTGITPVAGMSAIVKFSNLGGGDMYLFGEKETNAEFLIVPRLTSPDAVRYGNGAETQKAPGMTEGVLSIAGTKGYRSGLDDGVTIGAFTGTTTYTINIGRLNRATPGGYLTGYIQALYIYDIVLTPAQEAAIYARIAAPFELVTPAAAGEFMIVHMTDTHYEDAANAVVHNQMTQWIASHAAALGIKMVLHGGDIIYGPLDTDNTEWLAADSMVDNLDAANIPYLITTGNHDYDDDTITDVVGRATTKFNAQFPQSRYAGWIGGFYEAGHSENSYCIQTIDGVDWLFLALEFGPRQGVIDWANALLTTHSTKQAVIVTHSYTYRDGTTVGTGDTYDPHTWTLDGDIHNGAEMWTELVKLHDNIRLVISGHDKGTIGWCSASETETTDGGAKVLAAVANYQAMFNAGSGMMRFYRIDPTNKTIKAESGSPRLSCMIRGAADQFTFSWA